MESEVESIISPNPQNTKIYCNQVIVVETKFYQTEKLKSLYSGLSVHKNWTTYCAVSYVSFICYRVRKNSRISSCGPPCFSRSKVCALWTSMFLRVNGLRAYQVLIPGIKLRNPWNACQSIDS